MNKIALFLMILTFVVSSVALWLLESTLKTMLYFFEIALILIVNGSLFRNLKIRNE
ncbi:MAG: hypothetical protein QXZ70_00560 [Candidatus Bathyarchaeia archaeon]